MMKMFIPYYQAVFSWCALALLAPGLAWSATVMEVLPLTDRIVMVHFSDGQVKHSSAGQPWGNETVINAPLDTNAASSAGTWRIASTNDSNYAAAQAPTRVGRKSKGTDFAWLPAPNWTLEHWLYLTLPQPMQRGKTYTIDTGSLASNGSDWPLTFNEATARSEAVHVNQIGYVPSAPQKYAYVFHWAGDLGGLNLSNYAGHAFHLINQQTGAADFTGTLTFHAPYNQADTGQNGQLGGTLNNNYEGADVYECDFSSFTRSGSYVVEVDGIGCSFPFPVGPDVYRPAFYKVARGLYHNRSGIALTAPYTTWQRPAPHNPVLTPGFTNKLFYTRVRFPEWGSEGGEAKALQAGFVGVLQSAGWYQDAGDFDSYYAHLNIPATLLFTYEAAPENFKAGELNLPESTNGWPDILNEAAWLPRFCHRLRHELMDRGYCTGGIGPRLLHRRHWTAHCRRRVWARYRAGQHLQRLLAGHQSPLGRFGRGSVVHLFLRRRLRASGLLPELGRSQGSAGDRLAGRGPKCVCVGGDQHPGWRRACQQSLPTEISARLCGGRHLPLDRQPGLRAPIQERLSHQQF